METLINNNIFDSTAEMYDYKMATAFFCAIKSGKGAIISTIELADIFISGQDIITVMIEHSDVRQYLHTLEAVTKWLAVEFPEVSMTAKQHGYDIEFTLTPNLYK